MNVGFVLNIICIKKLESKERRVKKEIEVDKCICGDYVYTKWGGGQSLLCHDCEMKYAVHLFFLSVVIVTILHWYFIGY